MNLSDEKGLYPQKEQGKPTSPTPIVLGWGLGLTGVGITLFLSGFWTVNPDLWFGGTFFGFIGVVLLIYFKVMSDRTTH